MSVDCLSLMIEFKRKVLALLLLLLSKHGRSLGIRTLFKSINRQVQSFQRAATTALAATPAEKWQEQAAKLRKEIQDYETLKQNKDLNRSEPAARDAPKNIDDCIWQMTYRFNLGEEDNDDDKCESFGGTVNIKFRSDGYTDLVSQKATGERAATIVKTWGWDIETSPEDNKEYLLFSADFQFPNRKSQRLYFQARHSRATSVELSEGTITIKKDVVQKASRWALFSPAGILAQFRFAGNFVAKPTR